MKQKVLIGFAALLLISSAACLYGQRSPDWGHRPGQGPAMMGGQGAFNEGGRHFGRGNPAEIFIPEIRAIVESYQIKVQKAFLDAKQAKINLDIKREDTVKKIRLSAKKYKTDKSAGKDILSLTKELNNIQDQIMAINDDAMKKIQTLNQDREKEIKAAKDEWVKKIESDDKELEKYIDLINKRTEKWTND